MKYISIFIFMFLCAFPVLKAQDVIVLHSGESLSVYGVNVGKSYVTYKLSPEDKTRKRIAKGKVFSVKKELGEMVLISDTLSSLPVVKGKGEIVRAVDDSNDGIIASYNIVKGGCVGKNKGKRMTGRAIAILGVTKSSVLSNEDVEVEIVPYKKAGMRAMQYKIYLYNKSDVVLYVDLENSFRILNDGTSVAYYSQQKFSRSKRSERRVVFDRKYSLDAQSAIRGKKSSTVGIKVSESRRNNVSVSLPSTAKRLAIPPKGRASLPPGLYLNGDDIESSYDSFSMELDREQYPLRAWESKLFDESDCPFKNRFMVRYSTDDRFRSYSIVDFSLYLRELIGLGYFTRRVNGEDIRNYNARTLFGKAVLK